MSGTGTTPPIPDPHDMGRGPMIMGVLWTLTSIAIFVVSARVYARKGLGVLSWDDWIMVLAMLLQIVVMGFITTAFSYGLGKHDKDIPFDDLVNVLKWGWLNMIPGVFVAVLARVSSAIFLNRLFGVRKWFKWYLIIFTAIQCVAGALVLLATFLQVSPIEALWNPMITEGVTKRVPADVAQIVAYTTQALFTVSDLTYVAFPVAIIWRLNMSLSRRIGLALLMCTSIVTAAASIVKATTVQTISSSTTEPQYISSLAALWSNVEQSLVIIMSCVPTLRALDVPLFKRLASSISYRFGSYYGSGKGSSGNSSGAGATPRYYHDLEMNTHKLGRLHAEKSGGVSSADEVANAYYNVGGGSTGSSQSLCTKELPKEPCVRRTDQFTVTYEVKPTDMVR